MYELSERLKIKLQLRDKPTLKLKNSSVDKPHKPNLNHAYMSLTDLMFLYKTYENDLFLEDYFNNGAGIKGNMHEFLATVKEVLELEREIKEKGIKDSFEIMKYIYDKYKLECDYWSPLANYPKDGYGYFYPLEQDENGVINTELGDKRLELLSKIFKSVEIKEDGTKQEAWIPYYAKIIQGF